LISFQSYDVFVGAIAQNFLDFVRETKNMTVDLYTFDIYRIILNSSLVRGGRFLTSLLGAKFYPRVEVGPQN
jgi:hypothetical protein